MGICIEPETPISELLRALPEAQATLEQLGLACAICSGAEAETIADVARMHSLPLSVILAELRKLQAS